MVRTVGCAGQVQMIVPHGVGTEACYILTKRAVDYRDRRRCRSNIGGGKRKAPGRSAVPQILHRWVIIEIKSIGPGFSEELPASVGITDVRVIPAEVVSYATVGHLCKTAHVVPPAPGKEQRRLLGKFKTAILVCRLGRFCRAVGSKEQHGKRKCFEKMQARIAFLFLVAHLSLCCERVAFQFELSSE